MSGQFFFWLGFGLGLSIFPWMVSILIMHFLMPQAVLDRYWKEPHFRPFELMLFSGWSFFAPMRTAMFMWMFLFPHAGRRRGIVEPHRLVPRWYRIVSIVLSVWATVAMAGFLATMIGLAIYSYSTGRSNTPDWTATAALVVGIGCFAFVALRQWWLNRRDAKPKRGRSTPRKKKSSTQ